MGVRQSGSTQGSVLGARRGAVAVVLAALFLSGVAGIANQVLWQRALKVFLGGSETFSSLIVVLVFMLGLGVGAGLMGARAARLRSPIRALAIIELLLFGGNFLLAWFLGLDIAETVYAVERVAVSAGLPVRLVYAAASFLLLLPPTVLMGATLPVASEACQRQFGAERSSLISVLFFLNTLGAALGAFGSSLYMLPYFGQRVSLYSAALFNLGAAALAAALAARASAGVAVRDRGARAPALLGRLKLEEILGTVLGFLSLGYEMYLFRLMSLAHKPLPYTFATTLCWFLFYWSLGVYLASLVRGRLRTALAVGSVLVLAMPALYAVDRWRAPFELLGLAQAYFLPCIAFGFVYGRLVARAARDWGRDVGRFYAWNTVGSCLGILFFTLVGYEIRHDLNALVIGAGMLAALAHLAAKESPAGAARGAGAVRLVAVLTAVAVLSLGLAGPSSTSTSRNMTTFWGRDGVVEVDHGNGDVLIDGLWHTRLSDGRSHIGTPYSWMLAFAAVFCHRDTPLTDVLIVGNGIGLTAATVAKLDGVRVDAYEINHTLKDVLDAFPEATLGAADSPNVFIRWRDARTGMALDEKRYDVIISAPLHLKQAGSSLLLSREYMRLVKSRLRDDGVFAVYSYEGVPAQAALVARTIESVFAHTQTFSSGLLTVASEVPIEISPASIAARLDRDDAYYREVAQWQRVLEGRGRKLAGIIDTEQRPLWPGRLVVSDDHPLIEYPEVASKLLGREARRALEERRAAGADG